MSVVVKNIGALAFTAQGNKNTSGSDDWQGDQGTVRVVLGQTEYVWGPNDSKTLEDGIAAAAVAADARLRIEDTRDGWNKGQART